MPRAGAAATLLAAAITGDAAGASRVLWTCTGGDMHPFEVHCVASAEPEAYEPAAALPGTHPSMVPVAERENFDAALPGAWVIPLFSRPSGEAGVQHLLESVLCGERPDCSVRRGPAVTRLTGLP